MAGSLSISNEFSADDARNICIPVIEEHKTIILRETIASINKQIKEYASGGRTHLFLSVNSQPSLLKHFRSLNLEEYYKSLGYSVAYSTDGTEIRWLDDEEYEGPVA